MQSSRVLDLITSAAIRRKTGDQVRRIDPVRRGTRAFGFCRLHEGVRRVPADADQRHSPRDPQAREILVKGASDDEVIVNLDAHRRQRITLDDLVNSKVWVSWRDEPREAGGKPTKIPYDPKTG